jgi:hypothetical protein
MHKNPYWLAFLGIVAVATAWYGYGAIRSVQDYVALSAETAAFATNWSYEEVTSDTYQPRVVYHYRVGDGIYSGEALLPHPKSRNPGSAEEMVHSLSEQQWTVWYAPSYPNRSSLQKSLPVQECLSAITLLGVFTYLIWLGYSVGMARH